MMRKEPVNKALGKIIIEYFFFFFFGFLSFEEQFEFNKFYSSERLKSWFPQGGRLRQPENLHAINNIYFKFIVDLLRRKGKPPESRNEWRGSWLTIPWMVPYVGGFQLPLSQCMQHSWTVGRLDTQLWLLSDWPRWVEVLIAKPLYKFHPCYHDLFVNEPIGQA